MVLPGYGLCRSLWLSMQVALAAYAVRGGPLLAGLLLFGSWMNVQIFMLLCLTDDACGQSGWFGVLALLSLGALTPAYVWLFTLQFA